MSRKNKNFRAFLHQNPTPTIEQAWDAAWANQQSCFQSKRMQEQDDRIDTLEAIQEKLIAWVQHDCPFSREEILRIATEEAETKQAPESA